MLEPLLMIDTKSFTCALLISNRKVNAQRLTREKTVFTLRRSNSEARLSIDSPFVCKGALATLVARLKNDSGVVPS